MMLVAAQADGFFQRPCAVGVKGDARIGKTLGQRSDGFDFCVATQYAALELEIVEAIFGLGRFGQAHYRVGSQGCFMTQAEPLIVGVGLVAVGQVGGVAIPHIEQVAEHLHRIALLAFAKQGGHRHFEKLAQQVEQRGLHGGDGVDGDAQVEGLQAATRAVSGRKGAAHLVEDALVLANRLADH